MKTKVILLSIGALLLFSVAIIGQQTTVSKKDTATVLIKRGPNYVDNNKDSICGNKQNKTKSFKGKNFIDKNNDGICDNKPTNSNGKCCGYGKGKGNGNGYKHRYGQGNGKCCQYYQKK